MTELTDRMRTCAAFIIASDAHEYDDEVGRVMRDAADLLIEASNIIEPIMQQTARQIEQQMEIIEPSHTPIPPTIDRNPSAMWIAPGEPLPGLKQSGTISPRACPQCDSRAHKRVRRDGTHLMLICPVCANEWEFK